MQVISVWFLISLFSKTAPENCRTAECTDRSITIGWDISMSEIHIIEYELYHRRYTSDEWTISQIPSQNPSTLEGRRRTYILGICYLKLATNSKCVRLIFSTTNVVIRSLHHKKTLQIDKAFKKSVDEAKIIANYKTILTKLNNIEKISDYLYNDEVFNHDDYNRMGYILKKRFTERK
ncbi:unnamed protein product [Mytilus edulis]|uniref:Fibronectin type-III domain-containing protein n=1 Tax=Mytilus edulis TaxID=6550 RepID=A0A8S3TL54_MYTED|nr:unnamed protein product [Mytilus edulis]